MGYTFGELPSRRKHPHQKRWGDASRPSHRDMATCGKRRGSSCGGAVVGEIARKPASLGEWGAASLASVGDVSGDFPWDLVASGGVAVHIFGRHRFDVILDESVVCASACVVCAARTVEFARHPWGVSRGVRCCDPFSVLVRKAAFLLLHRSDAVEKGKREESTRGRGGSRTARARTLAFFVSNCVSPIAKSREDSPQHLADLPIHRYSRCIHQVAPQTRLSA